MESIFSVASGLNIWGGETEQEGEGVGRVCAPSHMHKLNRHLRIENQNSHV